MNVFIAGVYNSQKNSSYTEHNECNIIDTLRNQLNKFSPNDMVFVGGDFNSRSGTQNDFIIENEREIGKKQSRHFSECIRTAAIRFMH